ncbi:MAG: type II secretion system F family protein [Verrucomicrobia subdivision 3 bacterium]|nr:type II secretion system F family protein [Limisphaerales bacterium]
MLPTPGKLSQRAEFYHQLAQLTDAGIGLKAALEAQVKHPAGSWLREPAKRLFDHLNQGGTLSTAMVSVRPWVPAFDAALLEAGEQSGRLPACFRLLAAHYQERAFLAREVISHLAYPAFLFHFAVFIGPFPELFLTGDVWAYLRKIGVILLPIYAVIYVLLFATQGKHGEAWRGLVERIAGASPVLGSARRNLALARLATALHALLNAGVPIVHAWELAAAASGSVILKRSVARWRPEIEEGRTPSELVSETRYFPELFANMYHSGEISGTVDDSLQRLHKLYQENGIAQFRAVASWVPKIIYLAIVIMIAVRVVSFYIGYFGKIGEVMQ